MKTRLWLILTLCVQVVLIGISAAFPKTHAGSNTQDPLRQTTPLPTLSRAELENVSVSRSLPANPAPGNSPREHYQIYAPDERGILQGTDERQRITPTTDKPWRWIASLDVSFRNNDGTVDNGSCTGFFIGPRLLATAGHCVYDSKLGWATSIRVIPGRDWADEPFGSQYASTLFSNKYWTNSSPDPEMDFGAIQLPDDTLANAVGWFEYGAFSYDGLPGLMANLAGYPGLQKPLPFTCPDEAIGFSGCQNWFAADLIRATSMHEIIDCQNSDPCSVLRKGIVSYPIDTSGGQSGSPVWLYNGDQRVVLAIHTRGYNDSACSDEGGENNCGTLITTTVADFFEYWGADTRLLSIYGPFIAETPPASRPTNTPTFTPTKTATSTQTLTQTSTQTMTPTATPTWTPTFTLTPVTGPTQSSTITMTPTATLTRTPTVTKNPNFTNSVYLPLVLR